jgi:hypothetical protein
MSTCAGGDREKRNAREGPDAETPSRMWSVSPRKGKQ